jgi:hypothetical protein
MHRRGGDQRIALRLRIERERICFSIQPPGLSLRGIPGAIRSVPRSISSSEIAEMKNCVTGMPFAHPTTLGFA